MIELDEFLRLIEPNTPGAPDPLVRQSLILTAIRFCERTRLWRDHDIIETDGVDAEPIGVPSDSVLFEVAACAQGRYGEGRRVLFPITFDRLWHERPHWRIEPIGAYDGSRWYICPTFGTIQAIPRCRCILTVETVLKPTITAQTLPDFLFNQYGTDIANGTAGLVLAKPNETFGNPDLAGVLTGAFERRLGALSNMGSAGQQKGAARTRARFM